MTEVFFEGNEPEREEIVKPSLSGFWSERVFILTEDFEIRGYVFMPKTGRKNRILSDILNGNRRFVAVKDAEVTPRNLSKNKEKEMGKNDFIQLNLDAIILIRPCPECSPHS